MTASAHVYTAFLIGSPDVELSVRGGSITLDAGAAPHVRGTIEIAPPAEDTAEALDPRLNARIRVEVSADFPGATQARVFDLALTGRAVRHRDAVLVLTVASDEAWVGDYAPLADDATPRSFEASLRNVVDYVLDLAIPGAHLEVSPAVDADVTAYWALTNLVPNPRAESTTGFLPGANTTTVGLDTTTGGFSSPNFVYWRATAAGISDLLFPVGAAASIGPYTASAYVLSDSPGRQIRIIIHATDTEGAILKQFDGATITTAAANTWERVSVSGFMPEGTAKINLVIEQVATGAVAAGVDGIMLTTGFNLVPYFSGATTGGGYAYTWTSTPDASTSTRTPLVERQPEALTIRMGQSALDFLAPLVQAAGLRLVCDEQRRWTLRDETYRAPGAISIRHGVNVVDAQDSISRSNDLWFDAAVFRYKWRDTNTGASREAVDAFAANEPYTKLALFELDNTPYPGPGRAEYAVRRAQGRGREVTLTAVSDWRANAEQAITAHLEATPIQTGISQSVTYDLSSDEMTITTRTADTPPLAWVLGPDDLTWDDAAPVAWADLEDWSDL